MCITLQLTNMPLTLILLTVPSDNLRNVTPERLRAWLVYLATISASSQFMDELSSVGMHHSYAG